MSLKITLSFFCQLSKVINLMERLAKVSLEYQARITIIHLSKRPSIELLDPLELGHITVVSIGDVTKLTTILHWTIHVSVKLSVMLSLQCDNYLSSNLRLELYYSYIGNFLRPRVMILMLLGIQTS